MARTTQFLFLLFFWKEKYVIKTHDLFYLNWVQSEIPSDKSS